jgi:hypothetical protein
MSEHARRDPQVGHTGFTKSETAVLAELEALIPAGEARRASYLKDSPRGLRASSKCLGAELHLPPKLKTSRRRDLWR